MKKPTTSKRKQRKNPGEPPLSRSVHAELSEFHRAYSVFRPAPDDYYPLFQVIFVLCNPEERSKSPRGTSVNLQTTFERLHDNVGIPEEGKVINSFMKEFKDPKVHTKPKDRPPQTVTVSEDSLWSAGVELSSPAGPMFDASASSARASQRQLRLQEHFTEACQSASHLQRLIWTHAQPLFLLILEELDSNENFPSAPPQRALLAVVTTRTVSTIGVSRSANAAISAGASAGHGMTKIFAQFRKEKHVQVEYDDLYGVSALRFIVFPIECLAQNKWRIYGGISVCDSEFSEDDDTLSDDTRNRDSFYRAQKWFLGNGELPHGTNNKDISKSCAVQRDFSPSTGSPAFFNRAFSGHLDTDRQHVDVSRAIVPVPFVDIDITPFLNEFAEKQCRLASHYRKTASCDLEKLTHAAQLLRSALRKCCFESTVRTLYDLSGCYLRGVGVDMELRTSKLLRYCASGLRRNYDSRSVWLSRLALEFASYPGPAVERKIVSLALFSRPTPIWIAALAKASIRTPSLPPLHGGQSPVVPLKVKSDMPVMSEIALIPQLAPSVPIEPPTKSSPPLHGGQSTVVPLKVKSDVPVMSEIALIPQPGPSVPIEPPTKSSPPLHGGQSPVVPLKVKSDVPVILHDSAPADVMTGIERVPCSSVDSNIRGVVKIGVPVRCMALFKDGERAACGGRNGRILIVDLRRHEIKKEWKAHEDWVTAIAVHDDGTRTRIASGSRDGTVKMWLVDTGRCVATFSGHKSYVFSVAVIEDGRKVVSVSTDCTAQVWETNTARVVTPPFKDHKAPVFCVALLGDGEHVVTGGGDNKLRLWSTTTGTQVGDPFVGHKRQVSCVAASPDGRRLVSGSGDGTVRVWDVGTHHQIGNTLEGRSRAVECVSVSKDGGRIISGSCDKTIRVWDSASGAEVCAPLEGHTDWVNGVSFLADSDSIVSSSRDGTLRVWDVRSQKTVQEEEEKKGEKRGYKKAMGTMELDALPLKKVRKKISKSPLQKGGEPSEG